jgi:two-component system LytT family response regulator
MTMRALIVDDEPLARRRIRRLLREHVDVEVVGECGDGASAVAAVAADTPDLLFLDVQMPDFDGFRLLRALRPRPRAIVFTTAFDEYAVRAFEINALDYLVKPITRDRFDESVARARLALAEAPRVRDRDARFEAVMTNLESGARPLTRLVVRRDGRSLLVDVADVRWIEADRNAVVVHTGRDQFSYAESISRLEAKLDPNRFVRVHRSAIVSVECVVEVQPWFRGDAVLILRDGARVTLSRSHRAAFSALLGQTI